MTKAILSKTMLVGRATVFLVGVAVILALLFGVASTALAGTGVGSTFTLGKANLVDAISKLTGSTANSMLMVDNNGSGTAMDLRVGPATTPPADKTVAPMRVDSQAVVTNLNADELDGKDSSQFMTASTYYKTSPEMTGQNIGNGTGIHHAEFGCDDGDQLVTGGYRWMVNATSVAVVGSWPFSNRWAVQWANIGNPNQPYPMQIYVKCADTAAPAHN